jgi:CheY-like chemotaxis protein
LVDDLLDATRIARGMVELRRANVDLREVVAAAGDDFRLAMRDHGVSFDVVVPDEPVWAEVDATRITQVLGNLLHNASKYTRHGDSVSLSLAAAGGMAEARVRDTGVGIDASLLPSVFDPFVQGDRTLARTEGGLGLGLAVVKGITELHGGRVTVASAGKGQGSEFLVRLPLSSAAVFQTRALDVTGPSRDARRVLVVDDNADAAESLGEIVKLLGHTVELAYDGPRALEMARANPPDVVLCDIGLPGMTGYDVAKRLRAAGHDGVQLIAVSGYAQPEDVKRALEAGFDRHVAKPVNVALIERLLRR